MRNVVIGLAKTTGSPIVGGWAEEMDAAYKAGDITMPPADEVVDPCSYFAFRGACSGWTYFFYHFMAWFTRIASGYQPPTLD